MGKCKLPVPGGLMSKPSQNKESELSARLLELFPDDLNENGASAIYDELFSKSFLDFFGQWIPLENEEMNAKWAKYFENNPQLVNSQGEPKLHERNKEVFFTNKNGERWVLKKNYLTVKDRIETVNSLAHAYMKMPNQSIKEYVLEKLNARLKNINESIASINFNLSMGEVDIMDIPRLSSEQESLNQKRKAIRQGILENQMVLNSIVAGVKATLATSDMAYSDDVSDKENDEEGKDESTNGAPRKDSSEVRDTSSMSNTIKSILAGITDYEVTADGNEIPKISSLMGMRMTKNAGVVKNRIIETCSNIIELELSNSNEIQDPYDLMMAKLSERAIEDEDSIVKDFISKVNNALESRNDVDKEAFKTEFVTAFYKSSNVFTITELSEQKTESGNRKLILRHIDPASTQDKKAFIANEIVRTITNEFTYDFDRNELSNIEDYETAKSYLLDISSKQDLITGLKLLKIELNSKTIDSLYRNRKNVLPGAKMIGELSLDEMFEDFFNQKLVLDGDTKIEVEGLTNIIKEYSSSDTSTKKEIISDLVDKSRKGFVSVLSSYEAKYKVDLSDSSLFVGSKQRWMLSSVSGINKEILRWKAGNISSLTNKRHKNLQYVNYLLALDEVEKGNLVEGSLDYRAERDRRIAGVNIIINSEIKKKKDPNAVQHKEIGEADLHMDNFFKMFNYNDEIHDQLEKRKSLSKHLEYSRDTKMIVPDQYLADKSSAYSYRGFKPSGGEVEMSGPLLVGLGAVNRKILEGYVKGEFETMRRNSLIVEGYLNETDPVKKLDYLMKNMIPDYHYNSKGVTVDKPLTAEQINNGTWNKFGFFNSIIQSSEQQTDFRYLFDIKDGVRLINPSMVVKLDKITNSLEQELINIAKENKEYIDKIKGTDADSLFSIETNIKGSNTSQSMYNYVVNSIFNNIEVFSMFNGELGFYAQKEEQLRMEDALKRGPASKTDGLYLRQTATPINTTYRTYNNEEVEVDKNKQVVVAIVNKIDNKQSKYAELISNTLGKEILYGSEVADAFGVMTLPHYKEAISRIYGWKSSDDVRYNNLMNRDYKPTHEDMLWLKEAGRSIQSLKFTYFGLNPYKTPSGDIAGERADYLKYAAYVMAPAIIAGTELEYLDKQMASQGVDQVVFKSGSKASNMMPTTIHNESNGSFTGLKSDMRLNPFVINMSNLKLQVELPTKFDKDGVIGNQHLKNLLANLRKENGKLDDTILDYEFRGQKLTAKGIYEMYESTVKNILQDQLNKFSKSIKLEKGISGYTFDESIFRDIIVAQLDANTEEDLIEILQDSSLPLEAIPGVAQRMFPIISGHIGKKVGKVRTNSGSAIQVANIGFDSVASDAQNNILYLTNDRELRPPLPARLKDLTQDELKGFTGDISNPEAVVYFGEFGEITLDPMKGKMRIQKARIMLPFASIAKKTGLDYKAFTDMYSKGLIDNNIFKNLVGYRIPNQAISSNDAIEVVGILPPIAGDSAIVYHEITAKTGSDFDIDKMYLMMPNYQVNINNYKATLNEIKKEIGTGSYSERSNNLKEILEELGADSTDLDIYDKNDAKEIVALFLEKDNKDKEVVRRIKKNSKSDPVIESVTYISDNSSKGNQNALIEMMGSIMSSQKTYDDLMSPLDAPDEFSPKAMINEILYLKSIAKEANYLDLKKAFYATKDSKDKILKEFMKSRKLDPLRQMSPMHMIRARVDMLKAKKLVASMANHMTDIPMSQIANLMLKYDLGIGSNSFANEFIIGEENNSEAKLTKFVSYLMNAAVDAAKDNYIIEGNFNSYTVGAAMVMFRLGISPMNAFKVLLNDDVIAMSNIKQLQVQKVTDIKATEYSEENLMNYSRDFVTYMQSNKIDFNSFIENNENMSSELVLGFWNILQLAGKEMNNELNVSKADSNGAGKTIYEHMALYNKITRLFQDSVGSEVDGNFVRGTKLFKEGITEDDIQFREDISGDSNVTMLGAAMNNSLFLTNLLTKNMFIENTDSYREIVNRISDQLGKPIPTSADSLKTISNYVYPFIMSQSGHKLYNMNENDVDRLMASFSLDVLKMKRDNPDNLFLRELYIDAATNLVSFPNYRHFDATQKMLIRESLENIYNLADNSGLKFINDLTRYAFLTTGFKPTYFSMNEFLPKSYFMNTAHGYYVKELLSNMNQDNNYTSDEFIAKAMTFIGINNESDFNIVKTLYNDLDMKSGRPITNKLLRSKVTKMGTNNFHPFVRNVNSSKKKVVSRLYMLTDISDVESINKSTGEKTITKTPTYTEVRSNTNEADTSVNKNNRNKTKVRLFDLNTIKPENLFPNEENEAIVIQPEIGYVSELSSIFGENNLAVANDDVYLHKINKMKSAVDVSVDVSQETTNQEEVTRETYSGKITELKKNEVFVFGANSLGLHGAGAASVAMGKSRTLAEIKRVNDGEIGKWAIKGQTGPMVGTEGKSYGLVTVLGEPKGRNNPNPISEKELQRNIDEFKEYAESKPDLKFYLAYDGLSPDAKNLSGYTSRKLASMFAKNGLPSNIILEESFSKLADFGIQKEAVRKIVNQPEGLPGIDFVGEC